MPSLSVSLISVHRDFGQRHTSTQLSIPTLSIEAGLCFLHQYISSLIDKAVCIFSGHFLLLLSAGFVLWRGILRRRRRFNVLHGGLSQGKARLRRLDGTRVGRRRRGQGGRCPHALVKNLEHTLGVLGLALFVVVARVSTVVEKNLVGNELPQDFLIKSILLEFEIKILDARVPRLVLLLVQLLEERVLEGLLGAQPLGRVVAKQLAEEVEGVLLDAGEQLLEGDALRFLDAVIEEVADALVLDLVHQGLRQGAQESHEALHLFGEVFLPEEHFPQVKFSEDAAGRPHIYLGGVVLRLVLEQEFRGAEPAGDHVRRQVVGGVDALVLDGGQAEVADPQLALLIDQQVLRLDVPVDDTCRVDVLEPAGQLVHEELFVLPRNLVVQADDIMQVRVHVVSHDVELAEVLDVARQNQIVDVDDLKTNVSE